MTSVSITGSFQKSQRALVDETGPVDPDPDRTAARPTLPRNPAIRATLPRLPDLKGSRV